MDRPAPTAEYSRAKNGTPTPEAACCVRGSGGGVIPRLYRDEIVQLVKLAAPVVISQLMVFLIGLISMVYCGHMGKTELAAVSLAAAVVNITGISIGTGLSSACDTLISQTYGSGNLKRVGVILQRGILILLLGCFPCWAVLINTEAILLAFKQSPEVASLAQLYVKIFMPALPVTFIYQLQGKYLQNQGIMWPQVITGLVGNLLNALINYIFLYPLELGVAGSAAANAISQCSLALLLFIYIYWRGLHKATWGGWSIDCLREWGDFVRLAVPSMFMICLAWWTFEIGGFLAGLISEVELGAQAIVYQLGTITYVIPLGLTVAATVRVGNALGAGNVEQAKLSCKVPLICTFVVACVVGAGLTISRNVIGYIFTTEPDILQRVGEVMPLIGYMHIVDATAGAAAGVIRGTGKQLFGALCNLVGFYFIGLPIGLSLMFAANMGIVGLWTGLVTCVTLQLTVFIIFLCKLDWNKAVEEALVRAGVQNAEEKEMVELEQTDLNQKQASVTTTASGCVSAEEGGTDLKEHDPGHSQLQSTTTTTTTTTTVGDVLSVPQLVLRRGLALLVMVVILVAGIISSDLLVRHLKE